MSYHSPSSWSWSFPGGSPATSTAQNPTVTYSTAGAYNVVLTVSGGGSSVTRSRTQYIKVLPNTGIAPIQEGF